MACSCLGPPPALPTSLPNPCPTPPSLRKFSVTKLQGQFSIYLPGSKVRGYHPEDRGLQEEGSIYIFFLQISPASVTLRHGSWLEGELRAWLLLGTHTQEDYLVSVSLSLVLPPYMPSLRPTITPGPSLSINKAVDQGLGHEHPGGVERASLPATSDYPCLPETWPTSAPSHLAFFFFF